MANIVEKYFTNKAPTSIAPGVFRLQNAFVNYYMLGMPGEPWVMVDTGLAPSAEQAKKAADDLFGVQSKPEAIILTHGHFDHVGSAEELANYWNVPVYVHPMELPYVTGMSEYPPADPTVGGFGGQVSRFYSNKPIDLGNKVKILPEDGSIPGMSDWKWVYTPGHSPGHISLFRERDKVLIAGDALVTMNMRKVNTFVSHKPELNGPPEYFTPDWIASLRSIDKLASLRPNVIASGHGEPMVYPGVDIDLIEFANQYTPPKHGRYVDTPPKYDEKGVVSLPPPISDPLPKILAGVGVGVLTLVTTLSIVNNRRKNSRDIEIEEPIVNQRQRRIIWPWETKEEEVPMSGRTRRDKNVSAEGEQKTPWPWQKRVDRAPEKRVLWMKREKVEKKKR